MRLLLLITSIVFAVLAIVFTVLPMGTIGLFPAGLAIILAFIAVYKSNGKKKIFPKFILLFSLGIFMTIIGREVFVKDIVEDDKVFIEENEKSKQDAQKELEDLEGIDSIR